MDAKNYVELSRINWKKTDGKITLEDIRLGCLQRIATATEAMAANYNRMQTDLEYYKNYNARLRKDIEKLTRSNNALRGHITRAKKSKS